MWLKQRDGRVWLNDCAEPPWHVGQAASAGAFVAITRGVHPQPRHLLQLYPGLRPLEQLLAPDWRGSTRTVAFRTEPSATWEPAAGHSAAALADRTNIIAGFSATWHALQI